MVVQISELIQAFNEPGQNYDAIWVPECFYMYGNLSYHLNDHDPDFMIGGLP